MAVPVPIAWTAEPALVDMRIGVLSLQSKDWNDHFRVSHYIMERLATDR